MIKTILFDLDGTLLPMDQDQFINSYFSLLANKFVQYGYEPKELIKNVYTGTNLMVSNNGVKTNEQVFWDFFEKIYSKKVLDDQDKFTEFYLNDFQKAREKCGFNKKSNELIKKLKANGYQLILATNPLFPAVATESRIRWAGLDRDDFDYVTTYENSSYCKPNLKYYEEIINKLGLNSDQCLMVGNDISEDMIVREIGIDVFLLTDCLINKKNEDINNFPHGNMDDLINYINKKIVY